jgi:ribosome-associated heat shock protein Hsp15
MNRPRYPHTERDDRTEAAEAADETDAGDESDGSGTASVRIDKWLWAARFYKTRSLAGDAVQGGRVQLNEQRVKAAKGVRPGDRVDIAIGDVRRTVMVRALAVRRGSAELAATLYEETAESVDSRARAKASRPYSVSPQSDLKGRPTKRDRRDLDRFRGG